ncbi:MAG: sulfatase [Planctomycetes bacterium]|nr:sulfatase [Planctomycetota bacterium]
MNRHLKKTAVLALILPALLLSTLNAAEISPKNTKKLNFVFVLIDDFGWTDLGCFGSTFYETPNIDRLCADGMKFTNAYAACSVCSPTRASILTGKYPARIDLTNYIGGGARGKLLPAEYVRHMAPEEVTMAEAFKENGYTTFFAGKWHLGREPEHLPEAQGFDINKGGWRAGAPSYSYKNREGKRVGTNRTFRGGFFVPYNNPKLEDGPEGEYLTDRLTDESVKFLEQHKDEPFLLYLSHYAVHNPQQAKKEYIEKYEKKLARIQKPAGPEFEPEHRNRNRLIQNQPIYAAMIQSVDDSVGRVMEKLKELELEQNTAIIFMSDNGGLSTSEGMPTSNLPLRAGKGWAYEGGIREPVIVKWPGVAKPGSVCDFPIISNDFYPTMLDMANLPLKPKQHVDGISFASLLKGKKKLNRKAIYWHYPHYSNQGDSPSAAVRAGDFKYIEHFEEGSIAELYNLKDDLGERNNLAKKMPSKLKELKTMLHKWLISVDAKMPKPNPNYKPRKRRN